MDKPYYFVPIENMDVDAFTRLRRQKNWLAAQHSEYAEGLLSLIDHIQDTAVDSGVYTDEEVFGPRDEDGYMIPLPPDEDVPDQRPATAILQDLRAAWPDDVSIGDERFPQFSNLSGILLGDVCSRAIESAPAQAQPDAALSALKQMVDIFEDYAEDWEPESAGIAILNNAKQIIESAPAQTQPDVQTVFVIRVDDDEDNRLHYVVAGEPHNNLVLVSLQAEAILAPFKAIAGDESLCITANAWPLLSPAELFTELKTDLTNIYVE